ncbi:growth-regulating factor 6-like isoform X3 [Apium graveolens]|uniref:growth-regulating factor 6-like isoform X3 n=1 Tax=Apium graveolens TaxID=4045 RepID=UPI003D7B43CA
MDFGVDVVGLVASSSDTTSTLFSDPPDAKLKLYGSGGFKQLRNDEDEWKDFRKVAKICNDNADDLYGSKAMLQERSFKSSSSLFSDGQMLSFSSPNLQPFSYHNASSSSPYSRGYGSGGLNTANMHGILSGPFTPSQWMELQHQALIYKYITANSPVPSNLLNPIRKALDSAGFSSFSVGWGAFHLGFSNTDPEPGRCRRTDGKKWRCSRDAVPDQKYCERHVNRGRHRSRKPVEGQTGHSVSGTTNTTAKFLPASSALVVPANGTSNNIGLSHHQLTNLQHGASNPSASTHLNSRSYLNNKNVDEKLQDGTGLSMLSSNIGLKENQFLTQKQMNLYQEPSRSEFGLVCSDSLLNPFQKSTSMISYDSSKDIMDSQNKSQHSLRQFMDEWPKNQTEHSSISWPAIDMQSDRTQLSISIPMAASDFMSSTSSPTNENRAVSPLRLSRDFDSTQMGLGMNGMFTETDQRQANWIPIAWENSMGGPLGEVLHSTNNSAGDCNNASALNLMTEGWDSSPRLATSPTGVLQKTTFRSLSNSSAGSSPRTDNNLQGMHQISSSMPTL